MNDANINFQKFCETAKVFSKYNTNVSLDSHNPKTILSLLASNFEAKILKGLNLIFFNISKGINCIQYFTDVFKQIDNENIKIKKLVLIYLIIYADLKPDLAFFLINSIQKLLSHNDQIIRAFSIKCLSEFKLESIKPIFLLCLEKTLLDSSLIVKKESILCISKYFIQSSSLTQGLLFFLNKFLNEDNILIASSTIKSLYMIMKKHPNSVGIWLIIHHNFLKLCSMIIKLDEWTQFYLIEILISFSRLSLPKPKIKVNNLENKNIDTNFNFNELNSDYNVSFDPNLKKFLNSLKPLIYLDSDIIFFSITKALLALATPQTMKEFELNDVLSKKCNIVNAKDLIFYLILIYRLTVVDSSLFKKFYRNFFLFPNDSQNVIFYKMKIIYNLIDLENISHIYEELKYYILKSNNEITSIEAIKCIDRTIRLSNEWNDKVLNWIINNIKFISGIPLNKVLIVLNCSLQIKFKNKNQIDNLEIIKVIKKLSFYLNKKKLSLNDKSKGYIISIVNSFTSFFQELSSLDFLISLTENFVHEGESVRKEILLLAAKFYLHEFEKNNDCSNLNMVMDEKSSDEALSYKIFKKILNLSVSDPSNEIKDLVRILSSIPNLDQQEKKIFNSFFLSKEQTLNLNDDNLKNKNLFIDKFFEKYFSVPAWTNICFSNFYCEAENIFMNDKFSNKLLSINKNTNPDTSIIDDNQNLMNRTELNVSNLENLDKFFDEI